jgi:phosphatidylglycerol:prolipoprotein diacylglycerol transferase
MDVLALVHGTLNPLMQAALAAEWQFPGFDPALVTIPALTLGDFTIGPFPIRWYALSYIVGIVLAWQYMLMLSRRPRLWRADGTATSPLTPLAVDDFLFWATLGVLLGGRVGYVLFYMLPFEPDRLTSDPLTILRVWEGGMSFHGGLIGVILALIYVARLHKVPVLAIGDAVAAAAPLGLLLGRLANFINAELYGRQTDVAWAMKFPIYDWVNRAWVMPVDAVPRHPSQLYQAGMEGLALFFLLALAVWGLLSLRRPGLTAGLFLIGYGLARIIGEQFREPDVGIGFLEGIAPWMTMGILLSLPMLIAGLALVALSARKPSPPQPA